MWGGKCGRARRRKGAQTPINIGRNALEGGMAARRAKKNSCTIENFFAMRVDIRAESLVKYWRLEYQAQCLVARQSKRKYRRKRNRVEVEAIRELHG